MINIDKTSLERTIYTPEKIKAIVILAHGAGAGNQHDFIVTQAMSLAKNCFQVVAFNFPYMQVSYEQSKRRPPNKAELLTDHFVKEVELVVAANTNNYPVYLVGKSMGGRIASMVATSPQIPINGVIVLGYPFIPPGKPEKLEGRTAHFERILTPMFIIQGERDTFGGRALLSEVTLPIDTKLAWIPDGDHSFKPRKSSGYTEESNNILVTSHIVSFINSGLNNEN